MAEALYGCARLVMLVADVRGLFFGQHFNHTIDNLRVNRSRKKFFLRADLTRFVGVLYLSMVKRQLPQYEKGKPHWTVAVAKRKMKAWGYCSFNRRAIVLSPDVEAQGVDRQVFLHELFHKMFPWMDEDAVDAAATETDDALDVMGL